MSKFKVGDKVAYVTKPDEEIGEVNYVIEDRYGCHVFVAFNEKKCMKRNWLVITMTKIN